MKPGDLVEIIDSGGYYSCDPTLVDGEIVYPDLHVLRPLVNLDDGEYDNTKEST